MATKTTDVTGDGSLPILAMSRPTDGSIVAFRGEDSRRVVRMFRDAERWHRVASAVCVAPGDAQRESASPSVADAARRLAGWLDGADSVQDLEAAFTAVRQEFPC